MQLNGLQTTQLLHQADGDVERAFCSEVDAIYVDDQRLQELALAYAAYRWVTGGKVGSRAARGSSSCGDVGRVGHWRALALSAGCIAVLQCSVQVDNQTLQLLYVSRCCLNARLAMSCDHPIKLNLGGLVYSLHG